MNQKKIYIACIVLICIGVSLLWSDVSQGITAKQAYFNAESCYNKLRNSPSKMKYRENWQRCIKKFEQVYRLDPDGSWASAGLYMTGRLYQHLGKLSGKKSDLQQARAIYERIINRFPDSRYRDKASAEIRGLSSKLIAVHCPKPCWSPSCSAIKKGRLRVRWKINPEDFALPTTGHSILRR